MNEINIEERNRYYKELSIRLAGEGYGAGPMKDGLLPVRWLGEPLFRVTAGGGAQFREEELDRDGGRAAFDRAVDIAREVKQYMRLMDAAPVLKADGLDETYKLLADFGGAVLAGHPTSHGMEFVTWEWDYQHTGMWQGHYYGNNFTGAKHDFTVRSGLIPQAMVFSEEQLTDLCRCCKQALASPDSSFSYEDERRISELQEQIERLSPGVKERAEALEVQKQQNQTQTMY